MHRSVVDKIKIKISYLYTWTRCSGLTSLNLSSFLHVFIYT
ncbi:hypothetical protein FSB73_17215 [Arachidicoccus ginsenosidivorans]|uniref:Uncharacterized protein n=1 Tax=Arachidicoccus ginsenosidivorans TaxID=496057 RepID=A0A5B8VR21_9BACT|nr:hypothetical protein FSB73_17215 [Arachidicoccus ginsenosidivorans]